jgi:thiamine kinase-like enzyme
MTLELLKKIILKHFQTEIFSQENLSKLGDAEVYLVIINDIKCVVRITKTPYSIKNNYYCLEKLKKTNIVPKPIANGIIEKNNYSIETFLDGEIKSKLNSTQIIRVIKNLTQLHSIKNKKCGYLNLPFGDWNSFVESSLILRYSKEFDKLSFNASKYIEYALKNIPSVNNFVLLHGDLNVGNILNTKNDCFLFDFEGAFYAEKEYDISYLHYSLDLSEEIIDKISKEYGYDKYKIYYYTLCILIRKIALSPKNELKQRIMKIEKTYEKLQTF